MWCPRPLGANIPSPMAHPGLSLGGEGVGVPHRTVPESLGTGFPSAEERGSFRDSSVPFLPVRFESTLHSQALVSADRPLTPGGGPTPSLRSPHTCPCFLDSVCPFPSFIYSCDDQHVASARSVPSPVFGRERDGQAPSLLLGGSPCRREETVNKWDGTFPEGAMLAHQGVLL